MKSIHRVYFKDAHHLEELEDSSIELVVTSPPYPMIEMWDASFSLADPAIAKALKNSDGNRAFDLMHAVLQGVWTETCRVVRPGGIVCVNIGDAVRTINGPFQLFPNHAVIISIFRKLGFVQLPAVIWRKPTNAPNKFMGSGMLPPGAYVTLEHEYILIFRKGDRREFGEDDAKRLRRESAYFWEERNLWFSDVWFNLIGAQQDLKSSAQRNRSGAFPIELPYRLINMFTVRGDTVLDPFAGTGSTLRAAMCSNRHSISYEIDPALHAVILEKVASIPDQSHDLVTRRLQGHSEFIQERSKSHGDLKYINNYYGFAVMTRQEEELRLDRVRQVQYLSDQKFEARYDVTPDTPGLETIDSFEADTYVDGPKLLKNRQLKLF